MKSYGQSMSKEMLEAFALPDKMLGKDKPMTATEVKMRMDEGIKRHEPLLKAAHDRVVAKLLQPLVNRTFYIIMQHWASMSIKIQELNLVRTM